MAFWQALNKPAFIKALVVHLALVGLVVVSFNSSEPKKKPTFIPQHITAVVVERPKAKVRNPQKKTVKKKVVREKVKPKLKPKPKKKPKPTNVKPKLKKVAAKPKSKPKPKPKPKKEPAKKQVEETSFEDLLALEAKKIEKPPVKKKPRQSDAAKKAAQANAKTRARFIASEIDTYSVLIQQTVRRFWNRPPSSRRGMQVTLKIRLLPGGELNSVSITSGSGNAAFDRSAVNAVKRAGNFAVPTDVDVFDKHFRAFTMIFTPEDL